MNGCLGLSRTQWLFPVLLAAASVGTPVWSQVDRATLSGRVTETGKTGIPDVVVQVSSADRGLRRRTVTDATGSYQISGLPIGSYTVSFTHAPVQVLLAELAFKPVRIEGVELLVGETRTLDAHMEIGVTDNVETADITSGPAEHRSAEVGSVIQPDQIQGIPLNGRNWANLMVLGPGSIDTGQGNQLSIRFLGRSTADNNWTLDGIDSTSVKLPPQEASLRLVISPDAIAEFRVNAALYSVESGTAHGAQINIVSKSGSNDFHGGLFEFFRDAKLDARNPFDIERPPFLLHQFGGGLSGPLLRNRTFFYSNYEGIRQNLVQRLFGQVPSEGFRALVLSQSPALRPILQAYPHGQQATPDPRIDAYWTNVPQSRREDSGLLRIDHRFSADTTGFGRYHVDDALLVDPQDALLDLRRSYFRTSNAMAQLQRVFSPNVTLEGRIGMNRSVLHRIDENPLGEGLSVPGLSSFANSCSGCTRRVSVDAGTSYSLLQNLLVARGRHTWKAGGEIRRIQLNVGAAASVTAVYASLSDFAANRLDNVAIAGELATRGSRRTYYMPFVQDEIKIGTDFVLTLGLRYEYYSVMHEIRDRARVFDLIRCRGFCPAGSPFYFPDFSNFDPRVGLSWSPAALRNKTAIRAGAGIYHGTGENADVNAAVTSSADRFSLSARDVAGLSFPIAPFFAVAQALGSAPRSLQRDRHDPYSAQWGVSIEQELPAGFTGQAHYMGSSGHKLFSRVFINLIDPATGLRPLANFGKIDEKQSFGNSSFNGLVVALHRRLQKSWLWESQYLWSHSLNDNSVGGGEAGQPQNSNCRSCERANSDFDVRHSFTSSWIYQIPSLSAGTWKVSRKLLSDWTVSGLATVRTGLPVTVTITRASAALPDGNSTNQRPDRIAGISLYPSAGPGPQAWINAAAFATPAAGQWGNAGRNLLRGPDLWEANVAMAKRATLTERTSLHFRAEVFNLFNRAQYANPNANLSDPATFGRITAPLNTDAAGTGGARQIQFMLRLVF